MTKKHNNFRIFVFVFFSELKMGPKKKGKKEEGDSKKKEGEGEAEETGPDTDNTHPEIVK